MNLIGQDPDSPNGNAQNIVLNSIKITMIHCFALNNLFNPTQTTIYINFIVE